MPSFLSNFVYLGLNITVIFTHCLFPHLLHVLLVFRIWLQFFPRGSFLILNSADFFHENQTAMQRVSALPSGWKGAAARGEEAGFTRCLHGKAGPSRGGRPKGC